MEPKKDNIIQKITTERGFADEIYRKYKYDRYGIGSCCGSNLPSSIKDKYLCDYQDNKVSQYDNIEIVKTTYTPPTGGAQDDPNRPSWVDEYCGNTQGDVDIYFYYDATSLGLPAVQAAYAAASEWVEIVRSGNTDAVEGSCTGGEATGINEYHTTVFGERWLDWATSAMTGVFQNSGSCGGAGTTMANGSACTTGTAVDVDPNPARNFGSNACGSASDSAFPVTVNTNNKFWQILTWAQGNNVEMYNGGIAGATVANSSTTNNSGSAFSSTVTIGPPPPATNKNLLVICFADESTSQVLQQPYHDNGPAINWNTATDGTGTVTPCWAADHTEFISQRNTWMAAQTGRQSDFFLYPSKPIAGSTDSVRPFVLHSLGGISSGDKTPQDGTFNTIPYCSVGSLSPIGTSNPYFAQGYGALDQHGWGVEPATEYFTASTFQQDLDEFTELSTCNDSECFLFVIKNQNGDPVENHPIVIRGGIVGYTDENGLFRWCVENASDPANRHHVLDLCTCLTTTGGCRSQKVSMTVTDNCLTSCPATPFQACDPEKEPQSSGNEKEGCTDPAADNFDPGASIDDGTCTYCAQFNITEVSRTNATDIGGVCQNDGAINVTVNGGIAPYTYSWTGPSGFTANTQNISSLCGGVYTLMVSDSSTNPCLETMVFYLDQDTQIIFGCTDATACNYDAAANTDDGSCLYSGCTSDSAVNYDPTATADCNCEPPTSAAYQNVVGWDSCCTACVDGCMDPNANNYDAAATCDDGSCTYNWSCVETTVPGGAQQDINCQNMTYVGTFNNTDFTTSQLDFLNYISDPANNLDTIPIISLRFSTTYLAPVSNSCLDTVANNGAPLNIVSSIRVGWGWSNADTVPQTECNPNECGCISQSPLLPDCWPSSWTQFLPNGNYDSLYTHQGSWSSFTDLLNTTIADGQTWMDPSGATITTFTGLLYSEVMAIFQYSQGSCASENDAPGTNLIFPQCCCIYEWTLYGSRPASLCTCSETTTVDCNCTEMLDGTGIYPTENDCLNAAESCCNVNQSNGNFLCVPGMLINNCSNKVEGNPGATIPWGTGVNVLIANEFTQTYPTLTDPSLFYWNILNAPGACMDPTTNINTYVLDSAASPGIVFIKNGVVEYELPGTTNGMANSWNTILAHMSNDHGYDGVTYPSLTGMNFQQVLVQLTTSQPGVWLLDANIRACGCIQDGTCDCIQDNSGTYIDYPSCITSCCQLFSAGCTDPTSFSYSSTVAIDDGSCMDCTNPILSPNFFAGDPINHTITTTNPTSSGAADGTITVDFATGFGFNWYINPTTQQEGGIMVHVYNTLTGALVGSTPQIASPTASYTFDNTNTTGIPDGDYTIIIEQVILVNGILYVQCTNTSYQNVGLGSGSQLWECNPGTSYDESLVTPGITLNTYNASNTATYFNVAGINAGNTNGQGFYTGYQLALDDYVTSSYNIIPLGAEWPWWYQQTSTAGAVAPGVQCQNSATNAYKTSFTRIDFRDLRDGGFNMYSYYILQNNTWADMVSFVNGAINGTHPDNVSFTVLQAAVQAYSANYDLVVTLQPVLCESTGCGCVQSPTGTHATQAACDTTCCTIGCTDPAADNYEPNAATDDGSCLYCSNFMGVVTIYQPTIPAGSTNWNGTNINVNNGQILATGIGGSGTYNMDVYWAGYNGNAAVNPTALWPGFYKIVVTDMLYGCTHTSYQQLDPLLAKCHDEGSPIWLPTSLSQFGDVTGVNNFLNINTATTSSTNYQIYATSSTSFEVGNLNFSNAYTITIFDSSGTQLITCTGCDTLAVPNTTAGESYYIQIEQATDCAQIGAIFVMPTI